MPKELERKLRRQVKYMKLRRRKGETRKEAEDRYVYGTLRKTGWKPKRKKHTKKKK